MTLNAGSSGATLVLGQGGAGIATLNRNLTLSATNIDLTLTRVANTNGALVQLTTGVTYDFAFGLRNTTDSDFHLFNYGASFDAFKIARADSAATFYGTATVLKGVNAIAAGFVAQNTDTGNAAVIRNSLTCGTATGEFNVYSNTHASFANRMRIATNAGQIDFIAGGVLALNITPSTILIPFTANSTNTSSGSLIVGNGTNGGIGVSGYSYFGEQVNVKSVDSYGGPSFFANNGGVSLAGNAGSSYAAIKAYTNNAGTEKTISMNQSGGAGVNIGGIGAVAGGSLLASGTVTAKDFIVYNGPSVLSTVNARASRQGLVFNGTRGVSVAGTPFFFGTGNFTIAFRVRRDSAATQQYLIGNDIFSCFYAGFRVGGNLFSGLVGGSPNADLNLANEVGKEQHIVLTRSGTTLTCYANGVSVGTTTDSNNYNGSAFTLFAADSGGSAALVGMGIVEGVYNRALSAAEVVSLYQSGTPTQADYGIPGAVPASNTGLVGDAFTNFQYDTFTGASTTGFTAVETGGQGCQANTIKSSSGTFLGIAAVGTRYLVTFTATLTSGSAPAIALGKVNVGTASASVVVTNGANSHILTSTLAFTAEFGGDSGAVSFASVGNTSYAISGFSVKRLGVTLVPDANQPGGGIYWYDASGNNSKLTLPATGVSWNVPTSGVTTQIASLNGDIGFVGQNNSQGTASSTSIDLQNENGPGYSIGLRYFGNSFTQVNAYRANRGLLYGAFDINFLSGQYKFWFGGGGTGTNNAVAYEGFNIYGPTVSTGVTTIYFTTASADTLSGALQVRGGTGIGGNLNVGGNANISGTLLAATQAVINGTTSSRSIYALSGVGKAEIGYGPTGFGFTHPTATYIAYSDGLYFGLPGGAAATLTLSTTGGLTASDDYVRTGAAGTYRVFVTRTGANARWAWGTDSTAETGSNAGSDFRIYSFNDAGSVLTNPVFQLTRSTGAALFTGTVTVGTDGVTAGANPKLAVGVTNAATTGVFYWGSDVRGGMIRGYHDGGGACQWQFGRYTASAFAEYLRLSGTTAASSVLTVYGDTDSSSTITGALVVSGGLGVAKAVYVGGGLTVTGGSAAAGSIFKTSTLGLVMSGATGSSYDLFVTNPAGNYIMQVPTGTRNVEFAATLTTIGNITSGAAIATSAPVGGSGSWELGVYSTTAPAATGYVTIEIGGTAYKLLASNV
jgi:hypothetical protein